MHTTRNDGTTVRVRAAKACARCNARRIKCDATQTGIPCTKCRQTGFQDCKLIQSKRGTYPRKKRRLNTEIETDAHASQPDTNARSATTSRSPSREQDAPEASDTQAQASLDMPPPPTVPPASQPEPPPPAPAPPPSAATGPATSAPPLTPSSWQLPPSPVRTARSPTPLNSLPRARPALHHDPEDRLATLASLAASPSRYRLEPQVPGHDTVADGHSNDFTTPGSNITENSTSSYREISWTAMFDHFLEGRKREGHDIIDKCSITYLGESFPLALILQDMTANGAPRLHHAGPPLEGTASTVTANSNNLQHPSHVAPEDIEFLKAKEAFAYPGEGTLTALVSAFLERVYPLYPVVSLREFLEQYRSRTVPYILLNAICFVAATYCPLAVLHRAGFTGRKQARFSYYKKAKALFDTGYECNKIVILQSSILLTFWGGGPNNYWNFYSWIGTSVTIAETLGMHRSLAGTNMSKQDRSLLKRLWWILIIRDSFCGALVGRPFRIGMEHSDTELLTVEDFEHDDHCSVFDKHPLRSTYGLYQIHMSSLALILREIVTTRFSPEKKTQTRAQLNSMLETWRHGLPPELDWSEKMSKKLNVFASSLGIIYNHHVILIHFGLRRTDSIQDIMDGSPASLQATSEKAAHSISEFASLFVTRSLVLMVPHEAFSALFVAEVVFYTQIKSSQSVVAQLGRMSLNNCQMVLHNAREAWDPAPWVMQLFDHLISNTKEDSTSGSGNGEFAPGVNVTDVLNGGPFSHANPVDNRADTLVSNADFNAFQTNTLLSSFLSMPDEVDAFANLDFSDFANDFAASAGVDYDPMLDFNR